MAITSSLVVDGVAVTASFSIFLNGGTLIDSFTYNGSTNALDFTPRDAAILSIDDFLAQLNLFVRFNSVLVSSLFTLPIFSFKPVSKSIVEIDDDGVSTLTWVFRTPGHGNFFNFTCTYPGTITVQRRVLPATMTFPQWLYFLGSVITLIQIIKQVYKK